MIDTVYIVIAEAADELEADEIFGIYADVEKAMEDASTFGKETGYIYRVDPWQVIDED